MSLINKMLKDLEKRDAFLNENHDQVLDGLYSAYDLELKNKKKSNSRFYIFFSLVTTLILLTYVSISLELENVPFFGSNESIKVDEKPTVQEIVKENKSVENNSVATYEFYEDKKVVDDEKYQSLKLADQILLNNESALLIETKINRIDSIKFEMDSSDINLVMSMPYEIDYLVYGLTKPERIVIEVENAELGFPIEDLVMVKPIVAIRYSINDKKKFKLVLESSRQISIKKSISSKSNHSHDLTVVMESYWKADEFYQAEKNSLAEIIEKQVEEEKNTVFKGELIKTPAVKNLNAYAEKLFQEAYAKYKQGDVPESLRKLNMSLNQFPGHIKARSTMALILSEKDHYELAYSVLNEGLIQYPDNIEWIKMYARLLLNEGKVVEASSILAKQKPELISNTEYYALQAAILQKLSEHEQAAKIYRDLLHIKPLKGVWWVGLGISLESLKRYDDALYAYQKASSNAALAKDSRQFLWQRINRINNILDDEST